MKVWLLDPSAFTTRYDVCLAEGLAGKTAQVTLLTRRPRSGELNPESSVFNAKYFFYRWVEGPLSFLTRLRPAWLMLKGLEHCLNLLALIWKAWRERPDVIHFEWMSLAFFDGCAVRVLKKFAPVVLTVHDIKPFLGASSGRLQTMGWAWAMRGFDAYIVHSPPSREALVSMGFDAKKIATIPCGVLDSASGGSNGSRKGPKRILLFGNLKSYKGLDILVEAFGQISPQNRADWKIHVAGRKAMELAPIEKRAEELGVASQIDWDLRFFDEAEIPHVFEQSDIYVFPYKEIDTSAVFFSSLGRGKPVVATRIGAFAERIEDGESGLLFEVDDSAGLARHLSRLMADPELRNRLGENTKRIIESTPTWAEIGARTLEFYSEIQKQR